MRCRETIGDLHGDLEGLAQAKFAAAQRFAIDELADDVAVANVVNGDDVRMIQRRHGPRFAFEACPSRGIARYFPAKNLERDVAREARIARTIHFTHAARAQRSEYLVGAKFFACGKRHILDSAKSS